MSKGFDVRPLSASRLAKFRKCELLYLDDGPTEDTTAKRQGRAAHALILEGPEIYDARYTANGPVNKSTGKPFGLDTQSVASWEIATGKTVITSRMDEEIRAMHQSVFSHERARALLAYGSPELHIEANYCGIPCHGYADWVRPDRKIGDLKTCDDLDEFEGSARRLGYINQMSFYRSLLAAKEDRPSHEYEVFFVAVEKSWPFRTGVWRIGQGVLGIAQATNEKAVERLKRCLKTNLWSTGYEEVREFDWI